MEEKLRRAGLRWIVSAVAIVIVAMAVAVNNGNSTGGPSGIPADLGVVPAEGQCVEATYKGGYGSAETPQQAMVDAGYPSEGLATEYSDDSWAVLRRIKAGRVVEAWLAIRNTDGWYISRHDHAKKCPSVAEETPIP